jgi:DNA-3-methyladenine glycosylase I
MATEKSRCRWAQSNPLMREYHDHEWGVPVRDSRELWQLLLLEGAQAGLSWQVILNKREAYQASFHQFDPHKVARMTESDIERLLLNPGIVRSRAKIEAFISAAKIYVEMEKAGEDFAAWIWSFVDGTPIQNSGPVPTQTTHSEALSKALKKRGFKFTGPVITYAFMQAAGMVNDHAPDCFRREPCAKLAKRKSPAR